jgi:hypothetical protein
MKNNHHLLIPHPRISSRAGVARPISFGYEVEARSRDRTLELLIKARDKYTPHFRNIIDETCGTDQTLAGIQIQYGRMINDDR